MQNFLTVAQQVGILFVLMAFGAVCRPTKLVSDRGRESLVNLLILIVTPCLIVDSFQRPFDRTMLGSLAIAFVLAVLIHVVIIALAYLLVHHRDDSTERPLRLAATFSNAGFMGLPLEQAILGDAGVFFGVVYVVVFNLVIWSWGITVMRGGRGQKPNLTRMFVNPGTIGIALGLPLFLFSLRLPAFIATPVHLMANLNTPLAMIVIGHCLLGARLDRVAKMPAVYVATFVRLILCPLLMIAVLYPLRGHLDRNMMLALAIASSAPVAAMVSMFAAIFKRDVDVSVALISGTTLLSIITMPAVIAFAMHVLG